MNITQHNTTWLCPISCYAILSYSILFYLTLSYQERQTALINASGEGHLEIVRLLLERGANIRAVMHVRTVQYSTTLYSIFFHLSNFLILSFSSSFYSDYSLTTYFDKFVCVRTHVHRRLYIDMCLTDHHPLSLTFNHSLVYLIIQFSHLFFIYLFTC